MRLTAQSVHAAIVLSAAVTLAACGSGSAAGTTGPQISLTPAATTVKAGGSMNLTLQTTSATSCVGTSGITGPQPVNGTITVSNIMETTTFSVTCEGPDGTSTAQTEVIVAADAPSVTLVAGSTTIASGEQTSLSWNATNAQSCTSSGGWSGTTATNGTVLTGPLTSTTDYSLLCTGAGGTATQSITITVDAPAPVAQLVAVPSTVPAGAVVTLNYSEANATSCTLSGGGLSYNPPLPSGSVNTPPIDADTTFTLDCTGIGGDATQSATVTVIQPVPTVSIGATSSTIPYNTATAINWTSTNATSCSASGAWSGGEPVSGSISTGALTHSQTYVLTCAGAGGSATQSATVTVSAATPTVSIGASPSAIIAGNASTLTWFSANTTSCVASGGWTGAKVVSGSQSTGALNTSTTFSLTCTGAGGSASQSATVSVTQPIPTVTLSASPSTVVSGNSSTLTWSSTNATSCTASGGWGGSQPINGSASTGNLTSKQTFTLTCTGTGGNASQSATVSVTQPVPTVTLSANPSTVANGASALLAWTSTDATSCVASGGWSGSEPTSGSASTGNLTSNQSYTLTCTGPGGSAAQTATVTASAAAPTVTLRARPSSITAGSASTLTWSATNATSCTAGGGWSGNLATSGSQSTGALNSSTTFTLNCTGAGGSASQSATVTVTQNVPTVTLSASPSTVTSGSSATLTWTTTNATSCTASDAWSGTEPVNGSASTGSLTSAQSYTLTCTGPGGSASQSATVSVIQPVPTVTLSANPSTVTSGASATLTWSSTDATSCTASGGWSGTQATSGSASTGNLTSDQSFTLTCTGPGGSGAQTATVTVSSPAPTVSLSAGPSAITSGGSSTLTWSATNATSCTASGSWSGAMPVSGSQSTGALTATSTYTLTCTGAGGSASQSATVSVSTPAPTVTIGANPSTIASGSASTLTWTSTNSTSCTASGGWSGHEPANGSTSTGTLTATTTFSLSCTGAGGSASNSATVTVTAPAPIVTISANPTTVNSGSTSVLTWSSTNATTCTASNGWTGTQPTSGTQTTVALSATTKFVLVCTGDGGSARNSATVSVNVTPPTVSLSANPSSVASGGSSTLTWSSTNADSCAASGAFTGSLPTSGSQTVNNITSNATYTLTCTNFAGSNSTSATISVPPTIGGTPATTATVGKAYSFTPTVTGALGALLTFSIQHMPSWASFNTTTGALTGTPTAAGTFGNIIISVSDGIITIPLPAFSITVSGGGGSGPTCSASSGSLSLNAQVTRSSGISPLMVFFDATGTTDSALTANTTPFQDVTYSWNFGDTGASGTGTWAYGSNPGVSSKNSATGGIAGHLYITNSGDTNYTATVTATDGTNTASCQLAVAAYDPSGSNGFPGAATTCVSSSGMPVAGSGGCPVGANVTNQSSFASALGSALNGKRVLFKCGDTFTGNNALVRGQKFSVGAYGSCVGTTTNRPVFSGGGAGELELGSGSSADFDGRFVDLDLEGSNSANAFYFGSGVYPYQITLDNDLSNGNHKSNYYYNASQIALVEFVMIGMGSYQGIYVNNSENQCVNGSRAYNCGGNPNYENVNYQALLGSLFNGVGTPASSAGLETVRISACRLCIIENNTIENANNVGAVLKLHNGNPSSQGNWIGQYTELVELSDNLFTGKSGAQLVEIAPQNGVTDERLRDIVFERNLVFGTAGGSGKVIASVQNGSFRDNIFNGISAGGSQYGLQLAKRGVEWTGTPGAPANAAEPQFDEAFNNTCYGSICIGFTGADFQSAANNGWARNNLMHSPGGGTTVTNAGSGNSVSNNTTAVSNDPGFSNGSGSFLFITDYTPSAFYSGGTSAPVFFDAMGAPWSPTWDLGALHP